MNHEEIVNSVMAAFVQRLRRRDVDGSVALFEEGATLYGSEAGESARGQVEIRAFFERLFLRPHTYGWTWNEMSVEGEGGLVWFVAPASVVVQDNEGAERSAAYRLSGVLRQDTSGGWRFALFNGSEPSPPE